MTISSTTTFQVFNGGGTTFAVPFTFTANSQVKVYKIDDSASPATVTLQVEGGGSDYTIVGTNVVFNSATAATSRIYVGRLMPMTQTFDPNTTARFDSDSLELELDKIVKMIQELDERLDRGFVSKVGSVSFGEIPSIEDQAGKRLSVNTGETALEWTAEIDAANTADTDNRLLKSDGTSGNIQQTGITVDDSDNVTGVADLTTTGNAIIGGNLTVNGTTTTLSTTNLEIEDNNILINDGGSDATSEGAGLTVDRTGTSGSLIYKDASATKFAAGALASEVDLVGTSSTQTLTGKTIDADGAGNSITNIEDADIKAAANIAHTKMAALTASRAMVTDGDGKASASSVTPTELEYVSGVTSGIQGQINTISSNSGLINYCINAGAEVNTTGWATYADASAATPADGTGGTANITWTRSISSPLRGSASFLLTKDAADRQGEGVSFDFQAEPSDEGQLVAVSGEYSCSADYAHDDIELFIYDKDGEGFLTTYTLSKLRDSGAGDSAKFYFEFIGTAANGQYRMCIHVASTNANAYTVQFDNFNISPVSMQEGDIEILSDVKATGVNGGTFTSGARRTRVLNTQEKSRPWCTLSSNQFTLLSGRYQIIAFCPAYTVNGHRAYLYRTTEVAGVIAMGSTEYAATTVGNSSIIMTEIEIIGTPITYEISHWCGTTRSDNGFGVGSSVGSFNCIYTQVFIKRLGAPRP